MNYFEHNDTKGRDARRAVELNKAERAKAQDFDGTLFMTRAELQLARHRARRWFFQGHTLDSLRTGFEAYGRRMGWTS